jgi:hypothetical protein
MLVQNTSLIFCQRQVLHIECWPEQILVVAAGAKDDQAMEESDGDCSLDCRIVIITMPGTNSIFVGFGYSDWTPEQADELSDEVRILKHPGSMDLRCQTAKSMPLAYLLSGSQTHHS